MGSFDGPRVNGLDADDGGPGNPLSPLPPPFPPLIPSYLPFFLLAGPLGPSMRSGAEPRKR
jgi:hypothetical protein